MIVEKEVVNPFNVQDNYRSPRTSTLSLENLKFSIYTVQITSEPAAGLLHSDLVAYLIGFKQCK